MTPTHGPAKDIAEALQKLTEAYGQMCQIVGPDLRLGAEFDSIRMMQDILDEMPAALIMNTQTQFCPSCPHYEVADCDPRLMECVADKPEQCAAVAACGWTEVKVPPFLRMVTREAE